MIYKPMPLVKGRKLKFGYYVNPLDPTIALPNKEHLDALHYAFKMKARYGTSLKDCCMWLHAATGVRITMAGFKYSYDRWVKELRSVNMKAIQERTQAFIKERTDFIEKNLQHFTQVVESDDELSSVAYGQAKEEIRKAFKKKKG